MSEENEAPPTPTSPSDRRRKQSAIFSSRPQIAEVDNAMDETEHSANGDVSVNDDSDLEQSEDDQTSVYNTIEPPKNGVIDIETTDLSTGLKYSAQEEPKSVRPDVKTSHKEDSNNVSENKDVIVVHTSTDDIVYDETKPRRLPNPKKLHLDIQEQPKNVLLDSINYLISPDDPEGESPGRRRRRQQNQGLLSAKSAPNVQHTHDAVETGRHEIGSTAVANGNMYQRSPDLSRRKFSHGSSPVKKLITKAPSPSTAHISKRKISTDARIGVPNDRIHAIKMQPRRKISSDARLVGHAFNIEERQKCPTIEEIRKRKVSFDTTALVNGKRMMPLNDEAHIPEVVESSCHEHMPEHSNNGYYLPDDDLREEHIPQIYLTVENEEHNGSVTRLYTGEDEDEQIDARVYDNRAYVADDEASTSSITPPPNYYDSEHSENYHETEDDYLEDQPAVISHTNISHEPVRNMQKLSTVSLPASYKTNEPKSILKIRRDDSDSMISQESTREKKFNVRKDSIALFTSQSGQVALAQIRAEHESKWKRLSGSRLKELWSTRHDMFVKYKLHILVLILFSLTFTFVVVGLHLHSVHKKELAIAKKILFDAKTRRLSLPDQGEVDRLVGTLGKDIPSWMLPTHCYQNYDDIHDKTCLKWKGYAQLDIAFFQYKKLNCYNVSWTTAQDEEPRDCFNLGGGYWYGPVNTTEHVWPISKASFTFNVNNAKLYGSGTFSSAAEYYWISSNGWALYFDSNYPIEINWNKNLPHEVCMHGIQAGDFYMLQPKPLIDFSYTICNGANIKETHGTMREMYFSEPVQIPNRYLMTHAHWSSASNSDSITTNSSLVTDLADTISNNKFSCGTLELDGKWESIYGDMTFSQKRFENVTNMISKVRSYGCDLSLNIYPYFSYHSRNFEEGVNQKYFVMNSGKSVPALLKWENGVGAMLDVSNSKARGWFASKVYDIISDYGIKTFRLSYGKSAWMPSNPQFHLDEMNPNKVKHLFTDLITSLGSAVLQSTSQSQHLTSIIGVQSTIIKKDEGSCLKNVIPDIINYGLMGYPFLIADGLVYDKTIEASVNNLPSRDIYIRWMQLSAFLPAMKYTIKPWEYDNEVVAAARNLSFFHEKIVMEAIESQREDIRNGVPVIRPLWWQEPTENMSFKIDDEFLLGSRFLVAPILCESTGDGDITERDIYVPTGVWRDMINDKVILGPRTIKRYKVSQFEVPYFERMPEYSETEYGT